MVSWGLPLRVPLPLLPSWAFLAWQFLWLVVLTQQQEPELQVLPPAAEGRPKAADGDSFKCIECGKDLPRADFTKAQLTKHRRRRGKKHLISIRSDGG